MSKLFRPLVFLFAAALLVVGCTSQPAQTPAKTEIYVSAAASLKDALEELRQNYQGTHPNLSVIFNLGSSGALQKQIEQGAPADIFLSAAPKQMDDLAAKNLLKPGSRKNLLENQLVVIVPKDSPVKINTLEDLLQPGVKKIGIGETATVPAGQYALESLTALKLWDKLKDKAVMAKDVRTVLTYVETGNVEAGLVYRTDALSSSKVTIAAEAPPASHQPIIYPGALLAGSKQSAAAADFFSYLQSPAAQQIFAKHGFTVCQ